jgi:hypothetical protein
MMGLGKIAGSTTDAYVLQDVGWEEELETGSGVSKA